MRPVAKIPKLSGFPLAPPRLIRHDVSTLLAKRAPYGAHGGYISPQVGGVHTW